jgi:hypothetical protein
MISPELGYNLPMDVRVIIASRPDESFRVSVASSKLQGHVWIKKFESKAICLIELRTLGLLTALEMAEAQASDFAKRHGTLVFHAVAEPEALITAHFVDQKS